jgi:hypothetical protein
MRRPGTLAGIERARALSRAAVEAMKKPGVREAVIRSRDPNSPQAKHRNALLLCVTEGLHGGPLIEPGEELDDCIARISGVPVVRGADGVVSYGKPARFDA